MSLTRRSCVYSIVTLIGFSPVAMSSSHTQSTQIFPFRAPVPDKKSHFFINPNEMSSWGVAKIFPKHHNHFKKMINEGSWFPHHSNYSLEIKLETPTTQNISYEADILILNHNINPILSQKDLNLNNKFFSLSSIQFLGGVKFKKLITHEFGDLALTTSYKGGINCILNGDSTQESDPHVYDMDIGITFGPSIGVDYYFNHWIGVFAEGSLYYTIMPSLTKNIREMNFYSPSPVERYYGYTTTLLKIGLKTTF